MTEGRVTALASAAVVVAYDEVRRSIGARAAVDLMREIVKSSSEIAGGQLGVQPADFLREILDDLDDGIDPAVRERADA